MPGCGLQWGEKKSNSTANTQNFDKNEQKRPMAAGDAWDITLGASFTVPVLRILVRLSSVRIKQMSTSLSFGMGCIVYSVIP
jgi:hypothetical protein